MEAIAKLNENNLQEAFSEAKKVVKSSPSHQEARGLLAQLFCFNGEWDRADNQFEILAQQNPEMQVGVSLVRQLIRAEQARQQFFQDGRMPEVVGDPDEQLSNTLKALMELREQQLCRIGRDFEAGSGLCIVLERESQRKRI